MEARNYKYRLGITDCLFDFNYSIIYFKNWHKVKVLSTNFCDFEDLHQCQSYSETESSVGTAGCPTFLSKSEDSF